MNILILNGSPSGENSVTLQTMLYIRKFFPEHSYVILHVGQKIRAMEKDFSGPAEELNRADLIVFCYPVYTFLVPAQLHRFVELIKEHGVDLSGKYAAQLSTSKHFYDTTAHRFIRDNCADLGLRYIDGLSADMEDLLRKEGREQALAFFRHVLWSVRNGYWAEGGLPAGDAAPLLPAGAAEDRPRTGSSSVVIVADLPEEDSPLGAMIRRFRAVCTSSTTLVNLRDFPFAGGCLGCFRCAADGKCVYKDGFDAFLREKIQTADATVYAFTIRDHSMGYLFKLFDDRQFCNGHRTVTMGKPVGYLVDGRLSREENLLTLIEARAQVGGNPLAGIAGNERDTDAAVDRLAAELDYALQNPSRPGSNFYGVGGMKIFRDLIFQMQGMMREDHRFYKKHGFYDFPQKRMGTILGMYLVGGMMQNKKLARKLGGNMTAGMLMPYKSVVDKAPEKK